MLLNGISIQGSYHDKNQDSFVCRNVDNVYVAAVSDGLGSRSMSEVGSRALCGSVCDIVSEHREEIGKIPPLRLAEMVHERWLGRVKPYQVSDCYATMLFLLILPDKVLAARLGDGFVSFWIDDEIKVLFDRKEGYFENETDCLTEVLDVERIECIEAAYSEFHGGVLCSDGVGIGNMTAPEIGGFTRDFIEEYRSRSEEGLIAEISGWLADWTGRDDKTIAFVLEECK